MALGAQPGDVRAMFLRHGLPLTVTGIARRMMDVVPDVGQL